MQKGINTLIEETKQSMTDLVNSALKQGVPIVAIDLILQNLCFEVRDTAKGVIAEETKRAQKEYEKEQQALAEQVEYVPEETVSEPIQEPTPEMLAQNTGKQALEDEDISEKKLREQLVAQHPELN